LVSCTILRDDKGQYGPHAGEIRPGKIGPLWAVTGPTTTYVKRNERKPGLHGRMEKKRGKEKRRKWSGPKQVVGLLRLRNRRRGAMGRLDFSPKEFEFEK
jgi:hypothetical protein